jgi:hypothetical protein
MGSYLSKEDFEMFESQRPQAEPKIKVTGFTIKDKECLERIDNNLKEIKKGLEKIILKD